MPWCGLARTAAGEIDFVRDVRPIFERHCYECHGPEKQKSGLRLDIKRSALRGGEAYGAPLVTGNAAESPLWKFVADETADLRMPPEGARLTATEIATLKDWIEQGAIWPEGVDRATLPDLADHWSFKPLTRHEPPAVRETTWPRDDLDRFILARLEREQLRHAPQAPPVTWLRRVCFDLTGLPPTPEQAAALAENPSDAAYERVADQLLASPRYGERWGQHWLDVARYADTHGFEVNTEREHAWPYRDYVIEALNRDTPYDQFVREQIVGDALGQDAATGFLLTASVLLPGQIGADDASKRLARQDALDEIVTNIGQTFLGLSIGCARCHDHKFDPITTRDYYAMQAFVAGVEYADRELHTPRAEALRAEAEQQRRRIAEIDRELARLAPLARPGATGAPSRPPVNPRGNSERFAAVATPRVRLTIIATNSLEPCIDELEAFDVDGVNVALASLGATVTSSGDTVVADRHELRFANDGNYGNSRSWMSNEKERGWLIVEWPAEQTIDRVTWSRDRQGEFTDRLATDYTIEVEDAAGGWRLVADASDRQPLLAGPAPALAELGATPEETRAAETWRQERAELERRVKAAEDGRLAFAGTFRQPDEIHVLFRGDPEQPREAATPATPRVLGNVTLPETAGEQQRRQALADWIASSDNPLTARVMVNRLWQGHFGAGLVETANDFGHSGLAPTHPQLLDWLAVELIRSDWSLKRMHKRIVLSATYRQASETQAEAAARDGDTRLLWRYPPRRLEAEAIRDTMLAVSGQLNLKMGGPGFDLFEQRGGLSGFKPIESFRGEGLRRMIYAHKVRRERDAVFGAFDCPDGGQSAARRRESTTPIQALNLLNSRFTLDASAALAERARRDAGDELAAQVRRTFQLVYSREPSPAELDDAQAVAAEHSLATLCRALLNSNEFLHLP
ncbi:MAG: PSD1 and planctomycete cytochrome C domain-containing protein [Pirellulales bacterium]|nr:PSD1 and planctomycete cytochrome C domain-containing protein [Pirellulales bacterium]